MKPISYVSMLRFSFYICLFGSTLYANAEIFSRWFAVMTPARDPWIPAFLLDPSLFLLIKALFLLTSLSCAFSIRPKLTSALCFAFGTLYFFLIYSIGYSSHHDHLVWHVLFVFMLYEWLPSFSEEQFVLIVRLQFVMVFFSAGIVKLRAIGLDWFDPDVLRGFLLQQRLGGGRSFATAASVVHFWQDPNLWALQNLGWLKYLFYTVFPLELLAPALLLRKLRIFIFLFAGMQIFAALTLYAFFYEYIGLYFFWVSKDLWVRFAKEEKAS